MKCTRNTGVYDLSCLLACCSSSCTFADFLLPSVQSTTSSDGRCATFLIKLVSLPIIRLLLLHYFTKLLCLNLRVLFLVTQPQILQKIRAMDHFPPLNVHYIVFMWLVKGLFMRPENVSKIEPFSKWKESSR